MVKNASKEGFTLIELSLAMVFISLLSLAIVLIIMNTVSSYRRGLTLSKINSTGSEIVDDMRVAVQNSSATSLDALCSTRYVGSAAAEEKCKNDNAKSFISVVWEGKVKIAGTNEEKDGIPLFGAFCSGSYSYIWNSGYFFMNDGTEVTPGGSMADDSSAGGNAIHKWFGSTRPNGSARLWYRNAENKIVDVAGFRLLKIKDESRQVCVAKTSGGSGCRYDPFNKNGDAACPAESSTINMQTNVFNVSMGSSIEILDDPVDLLPESTDGSLALYDLKAVAPATSVSGGGDSFMAVSFILGTIDGGPDIKASGSNCVLPQDSAAANFDYCAINRFNFAARASGRNSQ